MASRPADTPPDAAAVARQHLASRAQTPPTMASRPADTPPDAAARHPLQPRADGPDRPAKGVTCPWPRNTYLGALSFNTAAFLLPALYSTLSKLWVAQIDASMVATTDVYTYVTSLAEILNEGLPRASWSTIAASRSRPDRLALTHTLILAQSLLGLGLSLALLASAVSFANVFVPEPTRTRSVAYVRICSFSALGSAVEAAVAAATRALDRPDVPLVIGSAKVLINTVLDLLLISTFRVVRGQPTVETQAAIRLACDLSSALVGVLYYFFVSARPERRAEGRAGTGPSLAALRLLARPGILTLAESAVRNVLYLWLVSTIVALGSTYATAWGVFNTIRWGLVMIPVLALEATTLAFVGHAWGQWRADAHLRGPALPPPLGAVVRPALVSAGLALSFEVPLCAGLSVSGLRQFARYLGGSDAVAAVTERMWRSLDWCYVMYAVSTQLAAVLLATQPRWFLWQSLASNLLYVLPWTIACQVARLDEGNAWVYHALVFGGSLVFSFVCQPVVLGLWVCTLRRRGAHPCGGRERAVG